MHAASRALNFISILPATPGPAAAHLPQHHAKGEHVARSGGAAAGEDLGSQPPGVEHAPCAGALCAAVLDELGKIEIADLWGAKEVEVAGGGSRPGAASSAMPAAWQAAGKGGLLRLLLTLTRHAASTSRLGDLRSRCTMGGECLCSASMPCGIEGAAGQAACD